MFRTRYRAGMEPQDSELFRKLRGRGFAVAIFPPAEVGQQLNRKVIEDEMVRAGRNTIKQLRGES